MTIEEFLKYMRYELNYSVHTVLSYKNDLQQFEQYLTVGGSEPLSLGDVTQRDVRAWVLERSLQGDSARTIRRKVQAVRALYKMMMRRGEVESNPAAEVELAKVPKRLPNYVRRESIDALIDGEVDCNDFEQVRNRLMLVMFYETGIRRAGIAHSGRRHRNAAGHLHDRQQRIPAGKRVGPHRHANDRKRGLRRDHARQVGRAAGTGDDDVKTVAARIMSELRHELRRAMR